jgi:hypothetical protein
MNLFRRILTYSVGIFIGLLLVYALLFHGREDRNLGAWLPNQRVLSQISAGTIELSPTANCKLECLSGTEADVKSFFQDAKVNFGKSITSKDPCPVYHISLMVNDLPADFMVQVCDSVSTIRSIEFVNPNCGC